VVAVRDTRPIAHYGARTEYALHSLVNLTLAPPHTAPSARELAEFQKLPVAFLQKVLTKLEKAGIVVGAEGVGGGWRLARPAEQISVLDVVEASQADSALFECREIRARCALWPDQAPPRAAVSGLCEIHAVMRSAEREMRRALASQSLADIALRVKAKSPRYASSALPGWFATRFSARRAKPAAVVTERERVKR
jgi:Rrf2 family protein